MSSMTMQNAAAPPGTRPSSGARDLHRGAVATLWSRGFAALYDPLNRAAEAAGIGIWRDELLAHASGDVLEIGAGTGTNLAHYPGDLDSLTLTEPDPAMRKRLERRQADGGPARVVAAPAEALAFEDGSFDTVVSTYVLCSVEAEAVLAEIARVLRPDGQLLFCEHVRSSSTRLALWQDRLNRPWRALACGCNCNRDTEYALRAAGFAITAFEHGEIGEELALVRPTIRGRAVPPAARR